MAQRRIEMRKKAYSESKLPYSFSYKIRNAFIGKECPLCKCRMGVGIYDDSGICLRTPMPTIQHNIPITLGGKHEISNISVICHKCNVSIGNRTITPKLNNGDVVREWGSIYGI